MADRDELFEKAKQFVSTVDTTTASLMADFAEAENAALRVERDEMKAMFEAADYGSELYLGEGVILTLCDDNKWRTDIGTQRKGNGPTEFIKPGFDTALEAYKQIDSRRK